MEFREGNSRGITKNIREPILAKDLGCTPQTLRNLRKGEKKGKYSYPPKVTEGVHWYKDGCVFWTPKGQEKAKQILAK
jgi:predicted transcriptional regulator